MKTKNTKVVTLTERQYAYLGEVRLPLRVVAGGFEFCVKETWLRHEYGQRVLLTWDEIDRLRGAPQT